MRWLGAGCQPNALLATMQRDLVKAVFWLKAFGGFVHEVE